MKKLTMMTLLLAGQPAAHAADYDYPCFIFEKSDGSMLSVSTDQLVLKFSNGLLVASNSTENLVLSLSQLSKMYFSEKSAGGTTTALESLPTADGPVEAFTTGGLLVGRYSTLSEARRELRKGVYVLKTSGGTFKTVVK